MLKWTVRAGSALLVLAALLFVAGYLSYVSWRSEELRELETGSELIRTARGEIEYAVLGDGVPFLHLHGNPGGYDQIVAAWRSFPGNYRGRKLIAVSRPGYLRTPLSSGATFAEQADLFAALLDSLGIEKTFVQGSSGGGYPALQFALRHPERCLGLVLLAPSVNYEPLPPGGFTKAVRNIPMPDQLAWVLDGPLFASVARSFIPDLDETDPAQVTMARGIIQSALFPYGMRVIGIRNDVEQRNFPEIDRWPLEKISAPTLLLHGDEDESSVYSGSVSVAAKIPSATLITLKGGDHNVIITRFSEIQQHVAEFVESAMKLDHR